MEPETPALRPVQPTPAGALAWLLVAAATTVALLAFTTAQVVGLLAHETETRVDTFAAADVERLWVRTEGGTVRVRAADVDRIEVTGRVSRGLTETSYELDVVDDELRVTVGCGDQFANPWCHVTLEVVVPLRLAVRVEARADPVHVDGTAGPVTVISDDADIHLRDLQGRVRAEVTNGSIRADGLQARVVEAFSVNGTVDVRFAEAPASVVAASDNGRVEVAVPSSDETYSVLSTTGNGSEDVAVRTDPTSERTIDVRSSNGDVTVRYDS